MLLLERTKLVVEGAGAASVAALLADRVGGSGPVVAVLSGGNIDPTLLISVMRHGLSLSGRYLVLRTRLPDRPGELIKLLSLVAEEMGNVLSVEHHREGMDMPVTESEIELTLMMRDQEHCAALMAALEAQRLPGREGAMSARRERKVVTVLFADLVGFTSRAESLDPEDVEAILRPYHERLRAELERHGGTVEKFIGDAVMALFGAPLAHEDDPERAVRAALAIRDWAREERRARGPDRHHDRRGARLARRPPGGGPGHGLRRRRQHRLAPAGRRAGQRHPRRTRRRIARRRGRSSIERLSRSRRRARREPVPVWEAVEARGALRRRRPSRRRARRWSDGRSELDALAGALARVRKERTPQLVTLVGVPGIGKSGSSTSSSSRSSPSPI